MKDPGWRRLALGIGLILAVGLVNDSMLAADDRPNVVLIMVDDMGFSGRMFLGYWWNTTGTCCEETGAR